MAKLQNIFTNSDKLAEFYRDILVQNRVNFIEKKKDNLYTFWPTRVHRKKFEKCMMRVRPALIASGLKVVDCASE